MVALYPPPHPQWLSLTTQPFCVPFLALTYLACTTPDPGPSTSRLANSLKCNNTLGQLRQISWFICMIHRPKLWIMEERENDGQQLKTRCEIVWRGRQGFSQALSSELFTGFNTTNPLSTQLTTSFLLLQNLFMEPLVLKSRHLFVFGEQFLSSLVFLSSRKGAELEPSMYLIIYDSLRRH